MRNSQIPGIREIPQIPGNLGNSPNAWESRKFLKCLVILEILNFLKESEGFFIFHFQVSEIPS